MTAATDHSYSELIFCTGKFPEEATLIQTEKLFPFLLSLRKRWRAVLLVAGLLACSAGVAASLVVLSYDRGWISFNHPDPGRFPIRGLDVSHHQGDIRWSLVAAGGFRFVYIKATEGGDFVDPLFARNWQASGDSGLIRGAYHFFTLCRSGTDQAQNFIRTVPAIRGMLPPVIDLEFGGNCSRRPSRAELNRELEAFSRLIRQHYRAEPVFYTTADFFQDYGDPGWKYHLWIRDIFFEPDDPFLFWQYTNRGRAPGIQGFVDINVFRWTELELLALASD